MEEKDKYNLYSTRPALALALDLNARIIEWWTVARIMEQDAPDLVTVGNFFEYLETVRWRMAEDTRREIDEARRQTERHDRQMRTEIIPGLVASLFVRMTPDEARAWLRDHAGELAEYRAEVNRAYRENIKNVNRL